MQTYIHAYIDTCIPEYITYVHDMLVVICRQMDTYIDEPTCMHAYVHTYIHAYIHTHFLAYIDAFIYARVDEYIHNKTDAYIHDVLRSRVILR